MRTKEEFNHYYDQELHSKVERIAQKRANVVLELRKYRLFAILLASIYTVLIFVLFDNVLAFFPFVIIGVVMISYVFYYRHVWQMQVGMNRQIKQTILPDLLTFIHPELTYDKDGKIEESDFLASNLFGQQAMGFYQGDDLIKGFVGDTYIEFSELNVQSSAEKSTGKANYQHTFQGLFFIMDFNKSFDGTLYVLPKSVQTHLSQLVGDTTTTDGKQMDLVTLENSLFNDAFRVRATDQILARYVLTPALMESIMAYKEKSDYYPMFSFSNGVLYLALSTHRTHFEFQLNKGINRETLRTHFEDINLALGMVDELQLNARLWGSSEK